MSEKCKRIDNLNEKCKKHRYEKSKLLELRKNKKCQEWPKVLNKRYIGIDGKWDPVGAFQGNNFIQRTQSRDDIQHYYSERYRKRQRDDYKYYYYGDSNKRYSSSYGSDYPNYYPSSSKQRYQYEDDIVYEPPRNRSSPSDYYQSYSYQSSKSRNGNEKEVDEPVVIDSKPEWFTGGPSNINETIELSGMSRELEAGILKNRKPSRRNDENFSQPKNTSPKSDSNAPYSSSNKDNHDDLDSHLMKIIKNNAKENDKRKNITNAKEVEKVLKSILLRPNEDCQEATSLGQNSNGVVRTVIEIEANLKLKGNRGAGDMSAYYKLLGLVQTGNDTQTQHLETSTNNNHPRLVTNSKYPTPTSTKPATNVAIPVVEAVYKIEEPAICNHVDPEVKEKSLKVADSVEFDKLNIPNSDTISAKCDETNVADKQKINGFNNFNNNVHSTNNALRNERLAMASRNMSQFSNHMLGQGQMGQNAYRWIRAMNNAAAASARMTQMNQQEYGAISETNWDPNIENKQEAEAGAQVPETNSMDVFNANFDNNVRNNIEQNNGATNHVNNYFNSLNLNNYMNPGSSLFNQLSMKQFLPFGYHNQNSMFGRQFLNPYLLQQLFMHKQWENRNFSLQNQLRQFQSMNFNPQQNANNAMNNSSFSAPASVPLNQGDCSAIGINK